MLKLPMLKWFVKDFISFLLIEFLILQQIALYNVGKVARQNLIDEFTNVVQSSSQPQVKFEKN